ncbi:MAG: InlB B-repeat-containing protein [Erysipelotrichaceae bacterium]|nr:InlB B-repeat-containing protein [Erysipelotrichaceae bacterium]
MVKKILKMVMAAMIVMSMLPVRSISAEDEERVVYLAFDGNGGSGEAPETVKLTIEEYEQFIMPECPFEAPEGKVFVCWIFYFDNTHPNNYNYPGRHPAIPFDTQIGDTLVVHALWADPADVCKIVYESNGGQGNMSPEYAPWELLEYFKLPECGFTNDSGIFANWSDDPQGTEVHFPESPTENGEFHLYAVWKDAFYITLDMGENHKELTDKLGEAFGESAVVNGSALTFKSSSVQSLNTVLREYCFAINLLISYSGDGQTTHNGEQFFYFVLAEDADREWNNTSLAAAYADIMSTYKGKQIDNDTSLTAIWLKPLKNVDAVMETPVCGTLVRAYAGESQQSILQEGAPEVTFTPGQHVSPGLDFPSEQGGQIDLIQMYGGSYFVDDRGNILGTEPEGMKIVGGQDYNVVIIFQPEYPYTVDKSIKGTLNGQEIQVRTGGLQSIITLIEGMMQTTVTAVHDWSEWTYDMDTCTKTRTCAGCGEQETKDMETFTLTFDLSGGTLDGKTGSITMDVLERTEITIPKAPEKKGYKFLYWEGSRHNPGETYLVTEPHQFTAVYVSEAPATGDSNNIMLYIAMGGGALVVALACAFFLLKQNRK